MADVTLTAGGPKFSPSNAFRSNNVQSGISVDQGSPVTLFDQLGFSQANAAASANCAGLAATAGEKPGPVDVQFAGPMTLTVDQWANITGEANGLTAHAIYYVSAATPGKLTKTAPNGSGQFVTPVGFALSATTMMIQIGAAVPVGSSIPGWPG